MNANTSRYDAVVIGAGAGGMSAAARLTAAGKKVLLVERLNRLGGRASSEIIDGHIVNIGAIAIERGFWLGDAFASGGSVGYDHKAMGITAKGAWLSVQRHFREMDVDVQTQPVLVAGCGDMSGDVFGNGMLLCLHFQIFVNPAAFRTCKEGFNIRLAIVARAVIKVGRIIEMAGSSIAVDFDKQQALRNNPAISALGDAAIRVHHGHRIH
jgi:hypothetical protein